MPAPRDRQRRDADRARWVWPVRAPAGRRARGAAGAGRAGEVVDEALLGPFA
ncbi:hypothetical protein AB1484_34510 [Parafrankia sp. FMc6]|uniref:hypothetical protein n=1 Tax=Parafrankia soli TaxID=2599596 RepID=UPI0034D61EDC